MRHCGNCKQPGHYTSTCPQREKVEVAHAFLSKQKQKRQNKCGKCGRLGHNIRNCTLESSEQPREDNFRKTLKDIGREILEQQQKKIGKIDIDGVQPKKGLWVVNPLTKRVAGKISRIKKNGLLVIDKGKDCTFNTTQEAIIRSGYKYYQNKPQGEGWSWWPYFR